MKLKQLFCIYEWKLDYNRRYFPSVGVFKDTYTIEQMIKDCRSNSWRRGMRIGSEPNMTKQQKENLFNTEKEEDEMLVTKIKEFTHSQRKEAVEQFAEKVKGSYAAKYCEVQPAPGADKMTLSEFIDSLLAQWEENANS